MLRAAARLFARQGVSGTSLAEIGIAAGYSRGLPVERYGSKRGLIEALLRSMDAAFEARAALRTAGQRGAAAAVERIEAHLDGARRAPLATAALYAIYVESLGAMPELRPTVTGFTERWRRVLMGHLRDGQRDGEIRGDLDCRQHAAIILGALRGLVFEHLMGDAATSLAAIRAAVLGLIDQALVPRARKARP